MFINFLEIKVVMTDSQSVVVGDRSADYLDELLVLHLTVRLNVGLAEYLVH